MVEKRNFQFRVFDQSIGALEENRLEYLKERLKGLNDERVPEDQRMKPFLNHYSGAGHFLVRLEEV